MRPRENIAYGSQTTPTTPFGAAGFRAASKTVAKTACFDGSIVRAISSISRSQRAAKPASGNGASADRFFHAAHTMFTTVRTCIVDNYKVAHINFWQLALNCKLVRVFAKGTYDIVYVVARFILLTKNADLMVASVNTWAHKVCHT